jgi:hypothetical protein
MKISRQCIQSFSAVAVAASLLMPVMADEASATLKKALDASNLKPGLWEIQHKTAVNGQELPDMQEIMAKVPVAMRGQVKEMMAKNGAGMTDKGVSVCLTAEQIANGDVGMPSKGRCKMSDVQHSGNKTSMKIHCEDPKGEGRTTVTQISPVQWQSTTQMTVEEQGKSQDINSEAIGKWLKTDCGALKSR